MVDIAGMFKGNSILIIILIFLILLGLGDDFGKCGFGKGGVDDSLILIILILFLVFGGGGVLGLDAPAE